MASLRTLGGITFASPGAHIFFIGEGLAAGLNYQLMVSSSSPTALNDIATNSVALGGLTTADNNANPQGHIVFSIVQNHIDFTYWLHAGTDPAKTARVGNSVLATWDDGGTYPLYGVPAVLTLAEPHQTLIRLAWDAAAGIDPLLSEIKYDVREGGVPPAGTNVATGLSGLSYTHVGLVNSSVHSHYIRSLFKYVDNIIPIIQHEPPNTTTRYDSNVLTATVGPGDIRGQAALDGSGSMVGTGLRTAIAGASLSGLGEMVASSGPRLVRGGAALSGKGTLLVAGPVVRETWGMIAS